MSGRAANRGFTLVEAMIAVAILGLLSSVAVSAYGVLEAPGRPGHRALYVERATEALVRAQQQALTEPFDDLLSRVGAEPERLPTHVPGIVLRREVRPAGKRLLRVILTADWAERVGRRSRTVVTLVAQR